MIEKLQSHYGFTKTPFGRGLAPQMLHRHTAHAEAVARIGWCISERGLGVITGEVGAGKTVAVRAALAGLDTSRHTVIYLGNPAVGGRGLYGSIVTALGGVPRFHKAALIPQTTDLLAAEHRRCRLQPSDRAACAPQGPARRHHPTTGGTDRHRLPAPGRGPAHRRARRTSALLPPAGSAGPRPAPPRPAATQQQQRHPR